VNEIEQYPAPHFYGENLRWRLINNVHVPIVIKNHETAKWSSTLNCHSFTREAVEYLGLQFSSDIPVMSDCVPSIIDIYLSSRLTTAQVKEEIDRIRKYIC
jgi:hypothetical protein